MAGFDTREREFLFTSPKRVSAGDSVGVCRLVVRFFAGKFAVALYSMADELEGQN